MRRLVFFICFILIALPLCLELFAEETITLTTYYPSPSGVYRELTTDNITVNERIYLQRDPDNVFIEADDALDQMIFQSSEEGYIYNFDGDNLLTFDREGPNICNIETSRTILGVTHYALLSSRPEIKMVQHIVGTSTYITAMFGFLSDFGANPNQGFIALTETQKGEFNKGDPFNITSGIIMISDGYIYVKPKPGGAGPQPGWQRFPP